MMHGQIIARALRHQCLARETAGDMTRDVFLRALSREAQAPADPADNNSRAYLRRISCNLRIDHWRRESRTSQTHLSDRARRYEALRAGILRAFEENWRVCGVRKIWRQLGRKGFDVARCTVARLMKGMGIQGVIRGKPRPGRRARTTRHRARWTR